MTAPPERLASRQQALASRLEPRALDGLLVSHLPNVAYLTGFAGSAAMALATRTGTVLVSDARYAEAVQGLANRVPGLTAVVVSPGGRQHRGGGGPCHRTPRRESGWR
jgi:Xaa-Pro aminopeptidase